MTRTTMAFLLPALACATVALAGSYVAVAAFGSTVNEFALGSVRTEVEPALDGGVDVYVPIVDWGVRADAMDAPFVLAVRFRSLDRKAARDALRSGADARAALAHLRNDVVEIARQAYTRAAIAALFGGIVGGLLGGGLVGALRRQRSWLALGALIGLLLPAVVVGVSALGLRNLDYRAFEHPTFYAQGRELPRLLALSEQLLVTDERYTESYEEALAGLANLVAFASDSTVPVGPTEVAVVASDLHSNALVLPVLREYGAGKPVFFVGDMTLLGTSYERRLARDIARVGDPVVAVSGNHDSRPFMRALAGQGVIVLTRDGRLLPNGSIDANRTVEVAGLTVVGYDDPLEDQGAGIGGRPLELKGEALAETRRTFVDWFERLEGRPDVVLVHQHGLAHALLASLPPESSTPLLILTGHDHVQHFERRGAALLVDGGTVGGGGPLAIGEQRVGFAELRFAGGDVRAIDLIEVEPLTGDARAERHVVRERQVRPGARRGP